MEANALKLFIVDDDKPMAVALKNYLQSKFGQGLRIFLFQDGENCLQNVDDETDLVVMDPEVSNSRGIDILKSIKKINPRTEVIMYSNNQDVATAIESYRKGAADLVTKDERGVSRIAQFIDRVITQPIRRIFGEFSVNKFVVIFLTTFIAIGIVSFVCIKLLHIHF